MKWNKKLQKKKRLVTLARRRKRIYYMYFFDNEKSLKGKAYSIYWNGDSIYSIEFAGILELR